MRVDQARGGTNRPGVPQAAFAMPPGLRMRYDLPVASLTDCVTGYAIYICEDSAPMENWFLPAPGMIVILLDAGPMSVRFRTQLQVDLPQATIWGPTTHAYSTTTQGGISVGVGLTAEGWSRLTRLPARPWRDRTGALSEVVDPAAVAALVGALEALDDDAGIAPVLDRLLPAMFAAPTPDDEQVRALGRAVTENSHLGVDELAQRLGIGDYALRKLANDYLGMPPQTALVRARFVRSYIMWLMAGRPTRYAGIDRRYFDEAHFLRDARNFLSSTPRRLSDAETIYLRTSMRARAAVIGAPAHVLHEGEDDSAVADTALTGT